MFNFNQLNILKPNEVKFAYEEKKYYSFVGIRDYQGKQTFFLPKGYDDFDKSNYNDIKKLFFSLYRIFEKFRQNSEKRDEEFLDDSQKERNTNSNNGAYIFTDEDNNETILYSKIDLIERIFKTYQELEIESLIQELGLIEEVDYSKIENYLDKGIYLNNNAIFIENMQGYRNIVRGVPSELIELFCYIYKELASELGQELSEQIKEIAFNFAYKYLNVEQSLFSEHFFDSTVSTLKDCLDNIHKTTAYKNHQYWDIYEAVEHFLYGSLKWNNEINQEFWGINNFSYIWEEMCNFTALQDKKIQVFYCDRKPKLGLPIPRHNLISHRNIWIDETWENKFHIELHDFKRWMRPDIIFETISDNTTIQDLLDNGVINIITSKPSLGFITENINVEFYLDENRSDEDRKELGKIYQYFLDNIKDIKNTKTNDGSIKKLKPQIRNLNISKNNGLNFKITNIPHKLYEKWLEPLLFQSNENSNWLFLVDWKYYSHDLFISNISNNSEKNTSIIKQLAYEFCLAQLGLNKKICNQFCVPYYDVLEKNELILEDKQLDCGIELVKINFFVVQEIYLNG